MDYSADDAAIYFKNAAANWRLALDFSDANRAEATAGDTLRLMLYREEKKGEKAEREREEAQRSAWIDAWLATKEREEAKKDTRSRDRGLRDRTYVVQFGDTLASISRRFYRSPERWKEILDANKKNIRNPQNLTVGQTLIIP